MNYRHIYHAGNFADVFKHWILTLLLNKLCEKPTPFCLIDTHAGLGMYDLNQEQAKKTGEALNGIALLLNKKTDPEFDAYLDIVRKYQVREELYPGSGAIMREYLRTEDRLWLCELHPEDYQILTDNFEGVPYVKTLQQDAYQSLKALLPPLARRGLILIDPPFEKTDEFDRVIQGVQTALRKFATGIYAIWYPIKDTAQVAKFYKNLRALNLPKILYIEFHANAPKLGELQSCGMVIINPPWQLDQILQDNLPKLLEYLELPAGTFEVYS